MSRKLIEEIECFIEIHKNLSREDILQYLYKLKTNYKRPAVKKRMENKKNKNLGTIKDKTRKIEIERNEIEVDPKLNNSEFSFNYETFKDCIQDKVEDTSQEEILNRKKNFPIVSFYTKEVINNQFEFLQSKHWLLIKRMYINNLRPKKRECECCGRKTNLNLHHLTYKNMGKEKVNELKYLCSKCHAEVHEREFTTFKDKKDDFRKIMIEHRKATKETEIQLKSKN